MFKAKVKLPYKNKPEEITVISVQIVPRLSMERNDLEYSLKQDNELHIIYLNNDSEIETAEIGSYADMEIVEIKAV